MNKAGKNIKKFLVGLLLLAASLILSFILVPWGLVEMIIGLFWGKKFWRALGALGEIIKLFATLIDVAGNVILRFPLNRILIKEEGYQFGSRFDTISYALGANEVNGTLRGIGYTVCKVLDFFDKDHCAKTYYGRHPELTPPKDYS